MNVPAVQLACKSSTKVPFELVIPSQLTGVPVDDFAKDIISNLVFVLITAGASTMILD